MELQKTNDKNNELNVEINCYVDKKNEIWFRGKELALILKYKNARKAIIDHVHKDDKKLMDFKMKPKSGVTKRYSFLRALKLGVTKRYPLLRALKRPLNVSS